MTIYYVKLNIIKTFALLLLTLFVSGCGGASSSSKTINVAGTWIKTTTIEECPTPTSSQQTIEFISNNEGLIIEQKSSSGTAVNATASSIDGFSCDVINIEPGTRTITLSENATEKSFLNYLNTQFNVSQITTPSDIKLNVETTITEFNQNQISYRVAMVYTNAENEKNTILTIVEKFVR